MDRLKVKKYSNPAGGRGAIKGAFTAFANQHIPFKIFTSFRKANVHGGFDCPGCAFPDKNKTHGIDSCEQGQKAIAWEMTPKRVDAAFFSVSSLSVLRAWSDIELEDSGRLTTPLRYDAGTDTYQPIAWSDAFALVARTLHQIPPENVAFYTSGRASNEAAFLWQLLARSYGTSHLPDSSNLCHEPSGFAMKDMLGVSKGTCSLADFEHAELIIVLGQNPASNHPRMMSTLHAAHKRGAKIIALNPLPELGFRNFSDPKDVVEMITNTGQSVVGRVYAVRLGGDLAALKGVMKILLERHQRVGNVIDPEFIRGHTAGFDAFQEDLRAEFWDTLLAESGLSREQLEEIADLYAASNATMCTWCMGITHHEHAHATVQMIINLLLLRGNIGKPGAGAVPVRGHSNVQGNRTMGATGKVPVRFLDNMEHVFGTPLQRRPGYDAVATAKGLITKNVKGFLALGGNFAVAAPDSPRLLSALNNCELTVHIATKLNRTHLYPGKIGLLLPSLGRTDIDARGDVAQLVTVEDSMSMTHASCGIKQPLSHDMKGEPSIVCGIGAALSDNRNTSSNVAWRSFSDDYAQIRDKIARCLDGVTPGFSDYNDKIAQPGGFYSTNSATLRQWNTPSGKAEFRVHSVTMDSRIRRAKAANAQVLTLMTIRSHDQFNTTVYSQNDRYRGIYGSRRIILMNTIDMNARSLQDGDQVDIEAIVDDGIERVVRGFRVVRYAIPQGDTAAYFPEATPLISVNMVSTHTVTPTYKETPVLVRRCRGEIE